MKTIPPKLEGLIKKPKLMDIHLPKVRLGRKKNVLFKIRGRNLFAFQIQGKILIIQSSTNQIKIKKIIGQYSI